MKPISTNKRSVQDILYSMVGPSHTRRVTDMDTSSTMHDGHMNYQGGGVIPTDPEKLKKGLAWVESRNTSTAMNPSSSATGKYQQMYKSLRNEPEMTFEDSEISNLEGIGGRSLLRNGKELTQEYKSQLGDKWNFREDEVAALSHFIGREGTRNYFASLRDNTTYKPPGINHTPERYLKEYNEGLNRK